MCYNKKQALNAAKIAKDASSSSRILIEMYMQNAEEVQLHISLSTENHTCCVHLDSYRGKESDHLEKVVIYYLSLSKYTAEYLAGAHKNIVSMLKRIGIKNGPVMMQGFYDGGKFRFFDPGLRFTGVDYERIYRQIFGVDLLKILINFSLTGIMPDIQLDETSAYIKGKRAVVFVLNISAGRISVLEGTDAIRKDKAVVSCLERLFSGENIAWSFDVNQRLAEIDMLADNDLEMEQAVHRILAYSWPITECSICRKILLEYFRRQHNFSGQGISDI